MTDVPLVSSIPPTESTIVVDGKQLIIARAVDRKKIVQIIEEKKTQKEKKDKRNLYLAVEGGLFLSMVQTITFQ